MDAQAVVAYDGASNLINLDRQDVTKRLRSKRLLLIEKLESRSLLTTFEVTVLGDAPVAGPNDAPGTLRQALFDANQNPGTDTIVFVGLPQPAVITLVAGELSITESAAIAGPGKDVLEIDAQQSSRLFNIDDGNAAYLAKVLIRDVTLSSGQSTQSGGAILVTENLTLEGVSIKGSSSAASGGAISAEAGETIITNSEITGNTAAIFGGGVRGRTDAGILQLDNTTVSGNSSRAGGGILHGDQPYSSGSSHVSITGSVIADNEAQFMGAVLVGGSAEIRGTTISGNSGVHGGGVQVSGEFQMDNSTVSHNISGSDGAGIHFVHSTVRAMITNSTISSNTASDYGAGLSIIRSSLVTIANSTITANESGYGGSGVHAIHSPGILGPGRLQLRSTIVSGNGTSSDLHLGGGSVHSSGYNLLGTITAGFPPSLMLQPSDVLDVADPGLGPLQNNGGATETHAVLGSSPAKDAGDPLDSPGRVVEAVSGFIRDLVVPEFDQREIPYHRVLGTAIDLGAFESPVGTPPIDFNNDGTLDCSDLEALTADVAAGTNSPAFDLDVNGLVNFADRNLWLVDAALANGLGQAYPPGDANLDGAVDGSDFWIWNANKFTASIDWCQGNFNTDEAIDGRDFLIWNTNKVIGPAEPPSNAPYPDVKLTPSVVQEQMPTSDPLAIGLSTMPMTKRWSGRWRDSVRSAADKGPWTASQEEEKEWAMLDSNQ